MSVFLGPKLNQIYWPAIFSGLQRTFQRLPNHAHGSQPFTEYISWLVPASDSGQGTALVHNQLALPQSLCSSLYKEVGTVYWPVHVPS